MVRLLVFPGVAKLKLSALYLILVAFAPSMSALAEPASGVDFIRRHNQFYIQSLSCEMAFKQASALAQWAQNLGEKKNCSLKMADAEIQNDLCEFDITNCVPDHVLKYNGARSLESGPNCWNAALTAAEILPYHRFSDEEEMAFYMKSPLCRPLGDHEARSPGDIGAIRTQGNYEIHGFIYVSDQLVYSKNGKFNKYTYSLQALRGVLDLYGVPDSPECRGNKNPQNLRCGVSTTYFRCSSLEKYLKRYNEIAPQALSFLAQITSFEHLLETRLKFNIGISKADQRIFLATAHAVVAYYQTQTKEPSNEATIFLLQSLIIRMNMIEASLSPLIAYDYSTREIQALRDSLFREISPVTSQEHWHN